MREIVDSHTAESVGLLLLRQPRLSHNDGVDASKFAVQALCPVPQLASIQLYVLDAIIQSHRRRRRTASVLDLTHWRQGAGVPLHLVSERSSRRRRKRRISLQQG